MSGWTITHQIPEPALLDMLHKKTKRPLALVVMGGDDWLIAQVSAEVTKVLSSDMLGEVHSVDSLEGIGAIPDCSFELDQFIVVNLIHGSACEPHFRHMVMDRLRRLGAKTVALIWIKGVSSRTKLNAVAADEALRGSQLFADNIDYLITLER